VRDSYIISYQDLPAPNEHAFILRRYDTGAISVTTMFKAAFPGATEEEEEREMRWVSPACFSLANLMMLM
jgi:hypothetical protein